MTIDEARQIFDECYIRGEYPPQEVYDVIAQYPPRLPEKPERNPDQRHHDQRARARSAKRDERGRFSL